MPARSGIFSRCPYPEAQPAEGRWSGLLRLREKFPAAGGATGNECQARARSRRWPWFALLPAIGLVCVAPVSPAADWKLPPLDGEISGEFIPLQLPGAPRLRWTLVASSEAAGGERTATLRAEGEGTLLRGEVRLDAAGALTWRLLESRFDVARWLPVLAETFLGPELAGIVAEGTVTLTGTGGLKDGVLNGRLVAGWVDGAIRDATQGWAIEGIALQGAFHLGPAWRGDGATILTFREATVAGVNVTDGAIEVSLEAEQSVRVQRGTASVMDGRIEVVPFTFDGKRAEIDAEARFTGLDIGLIARLLPPVVAEARGRVSGSMGLHWSAAAGLRMGNGRLQITSGQSASMTLRPTPGFLTKHTTARVSLLPDWFGPLARMFTPVNPVFETLRAIEMGEMRLEVNYLEAGLRPDGDASGRTARVMIMAQPAETKVVDSVSFEINVSGPLADVVILGLEGKMEMEDGASPMRGADGAVP